MRSAAAITPRTNLECTPAWMERIQRTAGYGSFRRFVQVEYLEKQRIEPGGFWHTYCGDEDVVPVLFAELDDAWPAVCQRIGIGSVQLPRLNATEVAGSPWTEVLRDSIGQLCCGDLERFGFRSPPVYMEG